MVVPDITQWYVAIQLTNEDADNQYQSSMHAHDEGTYTYIMHNESFCNVKYTSNNK